MTSIAIDRTDGLSSSAAIKGPCRLATTENIVLSGLVVVDGLMTAVNDRVLVKNQDDGSENGIWIAGTGPWRRARDFSRTTDVVTGTVVYVNKGAENAGLFFSLVTEGPIVVGTTAMTFENVDAISGALSFINSPEIVQKRMMICSTGTLGSPVYPGLESAPQGGCVLTVNGVEYLFLLVRVSGSTWATNETFRIGQYLFREDGLSADAIAWSTPILLGHQPLSGWVENDQVYLIGGMRPVSPYTGNDAGKGFSMITWRGEDTDQTDVTNYPVFGLMGSSHAFADFNKATAFISNDGTIVNFWANDTKNGYDDSAHTLFTYRRSDIVSLGTSATPIYPLTTVNGPSRENGYYVQGGATNKALAVACRGYTPALGFHGLQFFDKLGTPIRTIEHDDARAQYGRSLILDHPTLGHPTQMEVEGCDFRSDNELLVVCQETWRTGCPIVTYDGLNYASIASSNVGFPPDQYPEKWVRTTKAATDGAYNIATTYGNGSAYTLRQKSIYSIRVPRGDTGEEPIEAGITQRGSGANVRSGGNQADFSIQLGDSWQGVAQSENSGAQYVAFGWFLNSWRVYDLNYASDRTAYINFAADFSSGRQIGQLRVNGTLANGAGLNLYGNSDSDLPGGARIYTASTNRLEITSTGQHKIMSDAGVTTSVIDRGDVGKIEEWRIGGSVVGGRWVGTGSPEGVITAPVGSEFIRTNGGAGTTHYFKETGTGNTGWAAK